MENSSQTVKYLTIEDILKVASERVGSYQLLKENQLHYLIEIVGERLDDTELFPTLPKKAAVYAYHIITGHIFLDGNKRIGLISALWFLVLNGHASRLNISCSQRKVQGKRKMRAMDRYDGPAYKVVRKYLRAVPDAQINDEFLIPKAFELNL